MPRLLNIQNITIKESGRYFIIFIFLLIVSACHVQNKSGSKTILIIFDTDMESDVDDVGALAMLHALADSSETEILGVMVCAENPWSILCANRINSYFNRKNLPLGQLKRPGVNRESHYAKQVAEEFPGTLESSNEALDAVEQYRKILTSQSNNSVIILTVGYLTNLRDLLASGPDNYSNLNGKELVKQKVRQLVCMGGKFPAGREANIRWDIEASIEVFNNWPTEIIFSGWEIGNMDTGGQILDLPNSSPVRRAYELFGRIPHKSWDHIATLYAVRGLDNGSASKYWKLSNFGQILIDRNDGSNTWQEKTSGTHRYLIQVGSDKEIIKDIDRLMMHLPN